MIRDKNNVASTKLAETIIEGIQDKKGSDIILMDFRRIKNAFCDSFIICHGNSRIQAEAIAFGLQDHVKNKLGVKPWHSEGFENAEWILIDYVDVVVHIFQKQARDYYKLEDLWADAELKEYPTVK